jgi:hypothetical protein
MQLNDQIQASAVLPIQCHSEHGAPFPPPKQIFQKLYPAVKAAAHIYMYLWCHHL